MLFAAYLHLISTQVFLTFKTVSRLYTYGFPQNGLVINPDKIPAVLFSTAQQARKSATAIMQVDMASCPVLISDGVKIIHITLDQHLYLQRPCAKCMQICLSHSSVTTYSLVTDGWHGDYSYERISKLTFWLCRRLLYDISEHNLVKLQRAQNVLVRVVTFTKCMVSVDHIWPALQKLHWLPIRDRIDFTGVPGIICCRLCYVATFVELASTAVTVDQNCYGSLCV